MGLTISDMHQRMYSKFRNNGMTHDEAINSFPEWKRKQVLKDLDKDPFESHFGVKPIWFLVAILIIIIGIITFMQIYSNL